MPNSQPFPDVGISTLHQRCVSFEKNMVKSQRDNVVQWPQGNISTALP